MAQTKAAAIQAFFERFLPAYEETTVPQGAALPYLTYALVTDSFHADGSGDTSISVSLWYRGTTWKPCNAMAEKMSETLGFDGLVIPAADGYIWLKRGTPFAQNMSDPDDDQIRRKIINVTAEYLTKN